MWGPVLLGAGLLSVLAVGTGCALWLRRSGSPPFPSRGDEGKPDRPIAERRRWPRRAGNPRLVLISEVHGLPVPSLALVVDRSAGGLCLDLEDVVEVGAVLSLRVAQPANNGPSVRGQVRHCRQAENGWRIGCQFLEPLTENVLAAFG